MRVFVIRDS